MLAHLLGDGGEGLLCQLGDGAKAHGLRDIIGLLDRLEDPVDDAAFLLRRELMPGDDGYCHHCHAADQHPRREPSPRNNVPERCRRRESLGRSARTSCRARA